MVLINVLAYLHNYITYHIYIYGYKFIMHWLLICLTCSLPRHWEIGWRNIPLPTQIAHSTSHDLHLTKSQATVITCHNKSHERHLVQNWDHSGKTALLRRCMLLWFCGLLHGLYFWQLRRIACCLLVSVGCSEGRHFLNSNPVGTATRTSSASFSWLELSFWTSARLWATKLAINPSVSLENVRPFRSFRPLPVPVAYSGGTEEKIPAALPPRTCGISVQSMSPEKDC